MFQMKRSILQRSLDGIINQAEAALTSTKSTCMICNRLKHATAQSALQICRSCEQDIPWIQHVHCNTCGRYEVCFDCKRRKQTYFVNSRSAVRYDDMMKEWLGQYKYRKNERLAQLFIAMLMPTFQNAIHTLALQQQTIQCITFIPLSEQRMEERGFNQAEILAQGLSQASHIPLLPLLVRTRHTHKQSYKSRIERLQDLEGAFQFDRAMLTQQAMSFDKSHLPCRLNILLVDDVYTTGSTLNQCAKTIASALPARVYGLTWAR